MFAQDGHRPLLNPVAPLHQQLRRIPPAVQIPNWSWLSYSSSPFSETAIGRGAITDAGRLFHNLRFRGMKSGKRIMELPSAESFRHLVHVDNRAFSTRLYRYKVFHDTPAADRLTVGTADASMRGAEIRNGPTTAGGVREPPVSAPPHRRSAPLLTTPPIVLEFHYATNPNGQSYPRLSWPSEEFRIIGSR